MSTPLAKADANSMTPPPARLIPCVEDTHGDAIVDILNDAIVHSTALYDYVPRARSSMVAWFATKRAGGYPVIGAVDAHDTLLGFGTYGAFRSHPAYKYTIEHSIYVHPEHRGRGLGRLLLDALVSAAQAQDYHVMIGAIDADNRGSIALHEALGFVHGGSLPQVGFKFGRWLDLALYQRILSTPANPVDG